MKVFAPGPSLRVTQYFGPAAVDQATGEREQPDAHGARHGPLIGGIDIAKLGPPADEVVGQRGADEPSRVGEEVPLGAVLEARPLFEVPDGQLDVGVGPVENVDLDGISFDVGHEGVVTPLGPQRRLVRISQSSAPHDQTQLASLAAPPVTYVISATSATPSSVYSMVLHAASSMASRQAPTWC